MLGSTEYTDTFYLRLFCNKVQGKQARAYEESYSNTWTAQYRYDFAGRLIETTDINNNKSTVEYDICYKVSI
jgi:YD repeat-containing protein